MATIPKQRIEPVKTISTKGPRLVSLPLGATQTFHAGAKVVLSAGYVVVGATGATVSLGIAAEDATSGTAGQYTIKVYLADPDTIFVGNVGGSGAQVTALTDRGAQANLYLDTNHWTVDKTGTGTNARVTIIDLDPRDTVGDTNGRVHFVFKAPFAQFSTTS